MKTIKREGVEFLPIEDDHFSVWLDRVFNVHFQSLNTFWQSQRIYIYTKWLENWRAEIRLSHMDIAKIIFDSIPEPILTEKEKTFKNSKL